MCYNAPEFKRLKEEIEMKKIVMTLTAIFVLLFGSTAMYFKTEAASEIENCYCVDGTNVNEFIKVGSVSHTKRDFNGTSTDWQVNNYQYVYFVIEGAIDNSKQNLQVGDYFTIKLDDKIRPNGIIDERNIAAVLPVISETTASGEVVVYAVPTFNPDTNEIRYVLTEEIEKRDIVNFKMTLADLPNLLKIDNNGVQSFTHQVVGKPYTYSYDVFIRDKAYDGGYAPKMFIREAAFVNNVYINLDESIREFQYRSVTDIFDVDPNKSFTLAYRVSPSIQNSTINIYGVPEDKWIDGISYDVSTLENVTSLFNKVSTTDEVRFTTTVGQTKYAHYITEIISTYPTDLDFSVVSTSTGGAVNTSSATGVQKAYLEGVGSALATYPEVPKRVVCDVTVEKVDENDATVRLSGAKFNVFEVVDGVDVQINAEPLVTNADGKIVVTGLKKQAMYKLVEIEAPAGYEIVNATTEFTIDQLVVNNKIPPIQVQNRKVIETSTTTETTTTESTTESATETTTVTTESPTETTTESTESTSEESTESSSETTSESTGQSSVETKVSTTTQKKNLPKTGENNALLSAIGVVLMAGAFGLLVYRRQKNK